jgi:hypothetical protein
MRATLGILAGAFLLAASTAGAQEGSCTLRCTTIHQFFDDEITATIPLACDAQAIHCKGEGRLRINGEMVPAIFAATYTSLGLDLLVMTEQGELAVPPASFTTLSPTQSKTFVARWKVTPEKPNDFALRQMHAIGGHIKLTIENYERPSITPPTPVKSR